MCTKVEIENKLLKTTQAAEESTSSFPVLADIKLKKIPFYEELGVLMKPSILTASNNRSSEQIKCFMFNLTSQQSIDIEKNRVLNASYVDYTIQALLRICLVDSSEQNDHYPLNFQLRVNNRICPLPPFLPSRPDTPPKRASKPLNITPFVKTSSALTNSKYCNEKDQSFFYLCITLFNSN